MSVINCMYVVCKVWSYTTKSIFSAVAPSNILTDLRRDFFFRKFLLMSTILIRFFLLFFFKIEPNSPVMWVWNKRVQACFVVLLLSDCVQKKYQKKLFLFSIVSRWKEELRLLFSTYKPSTLFVLIKQDVNLSPPFFPLVGIACSARRPDGDGWWLAGWIRVCRVFPYIIWLSLSAPDDLHLRRLASPENTSD